MPLEGPQTLFKFHREGALVVNKVELMKIARLMQIPCCCVERGLSSGKLASVSSMGGSLSTGTMVAVPPALTSTPHNSASPCISLAPLEPLSLDPRPR